MQYHKKLFIFMVGVAGFEPTTSPTPRVCATRLRYTPLFRHYTLFWLSLGKLTL